MSPTNVSCLRSVCREAVVSSLEMADMVTSVLDTVAAYRNIKLEEVSCDWWRAAHSAHVTSTLVSDWLRSPVAARASSTASGGRLSSCRRRRRGRWRAARGPPAAPSRPARTRAPRGRGQLRRRGSHGSAACRAPAARRTSSRRISSSLSRLATVWNIQLGQPSVNPPGLVLEAGGTST